MNYYQMMDKNIEKFLEKNSELIACKQGCSKCCKVVPLMATLIEIDLIIGHVHRNITYEHGHFRRIAT